MYEVINLFGKDVKVKDHFCSTNPNYFPKSELKLPLYIKMTDACPAKCTFCGNQCMKDFGKINIEKLKYVLDYLCTNNRLHAISLTGGEPMLSPEKLNEVVNTIFSTVGKINIAMSTNGINFKRILEIDRINEFESVHLSRHHYLDTINNEIFGTTTASSEDIKYVMERLINKKLIVLNCLLMKKYINNLQEVKKLLDYAGLLGINKAGFVSLMKINDYSKENFINFNDIFSNLDENFFNGNHFYDCKSCECLDGIYFSKENNILTEYYARMVKDLNCEYTTQLVYTSDNRLTTGFGKETLV